MPSGGQNKIILTDEQYVLVEKFAGYGLNQDKIADAIGISLATLKRNKTDNAKFAELYARGKAKAEGSVGSSLYRRAIDGDVGAIKWWEQTRAGRMERSRQDVTQESTLVVKVVPHAE